MQDKLYGVGGWKNKKKSSLCIFAEKVFVANIQQWKNVSYICLTLVAIVELRILV